MPPEIMGLIFTLSLSRYDPPYYTYDSAPWIVSAVCADWRTIASTPTLWTTISDSDQYFNGANLESQLARSGDLPLDIHFHCEDNESGMSDFELEVFTILAQHTERWQTVNFSATEDAYAVIQRAKPQFSMLRKLVIEVYYEHDSRRLRQSYLKMFSSAPRLEEVSVNAELMDCPTALVLPWHQLRRYQSAIEWERIPALASATNLIECCLSMSDDKPANLNLKTVHLPLLLRLSVTQHGLLSYLDTPALLELYHHDTMANHSLNDLDFFRRLPRGLKKLVLASGSSLDSIDLDLAGIAEALPALQSFGCTQVLPMDSVQLFLRSLSKRPVAFEHISLTLRSPGGRDIITLVDFVDGMVGKGWCLQSLMVLHPSAEDSEGVLSKVEALRARGVDIQVMRHSWPFYTGLVPVGLRID
ncbi:hypothetical protein FB45DRAFT_921842 [Roridomyces roridus]|uniref:F-box domain-containing protein n=1 Tax=Roridomyces roridus TaxID=1738132 RepID=A0AAD7FKQ6_9AGAR|nr:hypothetical protein FB45DRAFT_921842 [Roridomyces roridus]